MNIKKILKKSWKFVIKPVHITPLIILIIIGLYLLLVKIERIDCKFYLTMDYQVAYEENISRDMFNWIEELLRDKYTYNISFQSYQEALAFEQVAFEEINRLPPSKLWKYHFWCGTEKTIEPAKIEDFIKSKILMD